MHVCLPAALRSSCVSLCLGISPILAIVAVGLLESRPPLMYGDRVVLRRRQGSHSGFADVFVGIVYRVNRKDQEVELSLPETPKAFEAPKATKQKKRASGHESAPLRFNAQFK